MVKIANRDEILEKLTELLKQFDIDRNQYQTDVYLYLDEGNNARLDTFVNVGGNSWLDDDHYTIYTDKEHYDDDISLFISSPEGFAEVLEISFDDFEKEVKAYHGLEPDEDISDIDAYEYICSNEKYHSKIEDYRTDAIMNDCNGEYHNAAEEILTAFEKSEL